MNELIIKYLSGNATDDEQREVEKWRTESNENAEAFFEASEIWHAQNVSEDYDVEAALSAVNKRISSNGENKDFEVNQQPSTLTTHKNWYRYAAAVALLIFGGLAFFFSNQFQNNTIRYSAELGEIKTVQLADGSTITLNGGAVLTHKEDFNGNSRQVSISGKAFFEIERNESKPFVIESEGTRITVLGTSFLVNTDQHKTEVVVSEGKVAFKSTDSKNKEVILNGGEAGFFSKSDDSLLKSKNTNKNYLAWKDKNIVFERSTIKEVIEVLEDVYKIDIEVKQDNILNCELTATFKERSIESVMNIIGQTFTFKIDKKGSNYLLDGKGC